MTYPPIPPPDLSELEPPDAIDRFWARRITPLLARLQREYPELYAEAERRAALEADGAEAAPPAAADADTADRTAA